MDPEGSTCSLCGAGSGVEAGGPEEAPSKNSGKHVQLQFLSFAFKFDRLRLVNAGGSQFFSTNLKMPRHSRSPSPDESYKRRKQSYSSRDYRDASPTRRNHQSRGTYSRDDRRDYDDRRDRDRRYADSRDYRDRDRDRERERDRDRDRPRDYDRNRRRSRSKSRDRNGRRDPPPRASSPRDAPRDSATNGSPSRADIPKADTTPAPATATAPAPVEDEKMRMKRERLEAWKKEREAKKALEEAKAKALALAAGGSGTSDPLPCPRSCLPNHLIVPN